MATGRPQPRQAPRGAQGVRPGARAAAPPPPKPITIVPFAADFKEPTPGQQRSVVQDDAEWTGDNVIVAGEFHPTPIWSKPGAMVIGTYLGMSENRGPNSQKMWHFRHDDGGFFDVWGATSLDSRLGDLIQAGQLVPSYRVRIVFKGDEPTKRGQNPTHTFDVRVQAVEAQA